MLTVSEVFGSEVGRRACTPPAVLVQGVLEKAVTIDHEAIGLNCLVDPVPSGVHPLPCHIRHPLEVAPQMCRFLSGAIRLIDPVFTGVHLQ